MLIKTHVSQIRLQFMVVEIILRFSLLTLLKLSNIMPAILVLGCETVRGTPNATGTDTNAD